jgi:ribosomal protein S6E (S10)
MQQRRVDIEIIGTPLEGYRAEDSAIKIEGGNERAGSVVRYEIRQDDRTQLFESRA